MQRIEYNLYRVKFVRPRQISLISDSLTSPELFKISLQEKPSAEFRQNYIWHIGNLEWFTNDTGYFAVGRTTKTSLAKFDDNSRNFLEEPSETSPYTHVIFNVQIGILAIAKKSLLAPTTQGIASIISKLLSETHSVRINGITVEIDIIPDPTSFIEKVYSSYLLKSFAATFSGPNPFDADEYFQKPLSVYLNEAKGNNGKASISGDDLDREVIEAVSRSTAATGNQADAKIIQRKGERAIKIKMSGDPIKLTYDEADHDIHAVSYDMVDEYNKVRNK